MTNRIARYTMMAAALLGLAGTPAMFAQNRYGEDRGRTDIRRDHVQLARENDRIRDDRREYRDDREDGRYYKAAHERVELRNDYARRNNTYRDLRNDRYCR